MSRKVKIDTIRSDKKFTAWPTTKRATVLQKFGEVT